ncbi:MAG: hypothetical protein WCK00_06740, partial [Deltaproteobacteria bacterium]
MNYRFLSLLVAAVIAVGIGGCGGGGTSGDPLGTDSITFADTSGSGAVSLNGTLTLKATVKNAAGAAVLGREVSFGFVSNASGATLASSSVSTNGSGEATIRYTAGATASIDVVRASISNGAYMDVNITVGGGTATGTDYISSLSASLPTLSQGLMTIITAKVSSTKVSNQTITFTIPVNNSGASFIDNSGASVSTITIPMQLSGGTVTTDISTTYKAGSLVSGTQVEDIVRATLGNGSTSSIIITRTAATATGTDYISSLNASLPTLSQGLMTIITAKVSSTKVSNQTITFTIPVNNSGASFIDNSGASVS